MTRIAGLILIVLGGLLATTACSPQFFPDWASPALMLRPIAGLNAGFLAFSQAALAAIVAIAGIAAILESHSKKG